MKERGILDYLSDWPTGKSADPESDGGIPAREKMPPHPEYGYGKDGNVGGFGHSDDCKSTTDAKAWGLDNSDLARGYETPKSDGEGGVLETRQKYGSFEQSIPTTNEHDRTHPYAKEHSETTGVYDGQGQPKSTSNPGGQSIGSRENLTS
jgi:hypothetical protein